MRNRICVIGLWLMLSLSAFAQDASTIIVEKSEREAEHQTLKEQKVPNKGLLFFYQSGERIDKFLLKGIDTNYIALPEHSWRLAYTTSMVGVNSRITSDIGHDMEISLLNKTTPSVDLGFYVGYRGFGFGYSWDVMHAYAQHLSFSLGSKSIGLDFSIHKSTNINTIVALNDEATSDLFKGAVTIKNTKLSLWYALNAAHYSHNAAIKQSYIQKKTAGSLLLHLSYMASELSLTDTLRISEEERPILSLLMSNMKGMTTRQMAVGLGYGINYTPNKGKVLLHASAAMMIVAYSIDEISYYLPDTVSTGLPGDPFFSIHPSFPVHVTGNMRAAVSWEINKWVHLSAWATGEYMQFTSKQTAQNNSLHLSNWDWKVQVSVGVRLGAGKDRVQRALDAGNAHYDFGDQPPRQERLPKWIYEYFYSPRF